MTPSAAALLAATALHLGFQLTVTVLVYPALARVPPGQWQIAHDRHSRAITPLVVIVYGALAATAAWALTEGSGTWTALAIAATWLITAVAARLHGRLGQGHDPRLTGLLLKVDRARAVTAALALFTAVLGAAR